MTLPFTELPLGHYYLLGGLLYRKVDDHRAKRALDGRSEAAPHSHEPVEPVTIGCRKESWPIPVDEQEWLAWRINPLDRTVMLKPIGVGTTKHQAIQQLAAELESDLKETYDAVR